MADEMTSCFMMTRDEVTQQTNINTAVTLGEISGQITTVSLTTAAVTVAGTFVVTNSWFTSESQTIHVTVKNGTNSQGIPYAWVSDTNPGSNQFSISVANMAPLLGPSFNGTLLIQVLVG